jgi:hypothetical protein
VLRKALSILPAKGSCDQGLGEGDYLRSTTAGNKEHTRTLPSVAFTAYKLAKADRSMETSLLCVWLIAVTIFLPLPTVRPTRSATPRCTFRTQPVQGYFVNPQVQRLYNLVERHWLAALSPGGHCLCPVTGLGNLHVKQKHGALTGSGDVMGAKGRTVQWHRNCHKISLKLCR